MVLIELTKRHTPDDEKTIFLFNPETLESIECCEGLTLITTQAGNVLSVDESIEDLTKRLQKAASISGESLLVIKRLPKENENIS